MVGHQRKHFDAAIAADTKKHKQSIFEYAIEQARTDNALLAAILRKCLPDLKAVEAQVNTEKPFQFIVVRSSGEQVELNQRYDDGGAVILPPEKVRDCGRWLLQTIGQNSHGLPKELTDILARLITHKKAGQILECGDKTKIKDALKVLRRDQLKLKNEGKLLRLISNNAI